MKPTINFDYINFHCDCSKFEIPHFYDKQTWNPGETYRMRVSNIYDPSKFWIVLKEQELNMFQEYLSSYYNHYGSYYKISVPISRNMYCAAFTEGAFYRGVIVNIPHNLGLVKKAVVFLLDFGYTSVIDLEDLYYLSEKLYHVPQFAVRASLSNVQPYDKPTWDYGDVKRFSDLVSNKVLLCILECTDPSRRIVEISVASVDEFSTVTDISSVLINEKIAMSAKREIATKNVKNSRYSPTTKYPHLFPSFEAIERGIAPSSVYTSDLLKQCVARDILYKPYFVYTGNSGS